MSEIKVMDDFLPTGAEFKFDGALNQPEDLE